MNSTNSILPALSTEQQQHAIKVHDELVLRINQSGPLQFDEFMSICLYEPGLGYYAIDQSIFGRDGDFITAPELSDLFCHAVGNQCLEIFQHLPNANIIELGAGSGKMTASLLSYLESKQQLPNSYTIVETSESLITRQKKLIQQHIPQLMSCITWLKKPQFETQSAIVIANEFFDALPFRRFEYSNEVWLEHLVELKQQQFIWVQKSVDEQTGLVLTELQQQGLVRHQSGIIDLPLIYANWMKTLETVLEEGIVLAIDYGASYKESEHSLQGMDSMRCFFQHHVHGDPFINLGLQDITCHVPFSILKAYAEQAGFSLAGYTTQAHFLLGNHIDELYTAEIEKNQALREHLAQQFKTLTMPTEMGERFKVIALSKNFSHALSGFSIRDFSHQL